jgi:hypothetical protein
MSNRRNWSPGLLESNQVLKSNQGRKGIQIRAAIQILLQGTTSSEQTISLKQLQMACKLVWAFSATASITITTTALDIIITTTMDIFMEVGILEGGPLADMMVAAEVTQAAEVMEVVEEEAAEAMGAEEAAVAKEFR